MLNLCRWLWVKFLQLNSKEIVYLLQINIQTFFYFNVKSLLCFTRTESDFQLDFKYWPFFRGYEASKTRLPLQRRPTHMLTFQNSIHRWVLISEVCKRVLKKVKKKLVTFIMVSWLCLDNVIFFRSFTCCCRDSYSFKLEDAHRTVLFARC